MKRNMAVVLALILIVLNNTAIMAHPEAIEKKTIALKADALLVNQVGTAGSSTAEKAVTSYTVEYINPENATETNKMFPTNHYTKLGTDVIWRVDIGSVKNAADFRLKFSFATGTVSNNYIRIYCADYDSGEKLISDLSPGDSKSVTEMPDVCTSYNSKLIYEYKHTSTTVVKSDVELSVDDSSKVNPKKDGNILEEHINTAIENGEDAVYFLVRGVVSSSGDEDTKAGSYCMLYNSASEEKAPILTLTGSDILSEVIKTEAGHTYKVHNIKEYVASAIVFVAVYDTDETLIKVATSGEVAVTEENDAIDVSIACADAVSFKAYTWKTRTLEPVTYTETIDLLGNA